MNFDILKKLGSFRNAVPGGIISSANINANFQSIKDTFNDNIDSIKRFFTDVDDTPTKDSDNLVTSGGVKAAIDYAFSEDMVIAAGESAARAEASAKAAEEAVKTITVDDSLSVPGAPADAQVVGNSLRSKVSLPASNSYGNSGQLLRSTGDGTEWVNYGTPSDEQTAAAIQDWLNEHPEATTTVEDGSITGAKLSAETKNLFFELTARNENKIASGTDYNTLLTPGSYFCHTTASANSMSNCPTKSPHKLFVIETSLNRYIQLIFANNQSLSIFRRLYNGTSWSEWNSVAERANTFTTRSISGITDLNDCDEIGIYVVTSGGLNSINNLPEKTAGRLLVFTEGSESYFQVYFTASNVAYHRYKTSSGWSTWRKVITSDNYKYLLNTNLDNASILSRETDYNSLLTPGTYVVTAGSIAQTMLNCPTDVVHALIVSRINKTVDNRFIQIIVCQNATCDIYIRFLTDTTAYNWQKINGLFPENNAHVRKLSTELNKACTSCYAVESTLPIMTHEVGVSEYYNKGDYIPGVLYSSVWRDGTDVFRNLTLETFYSAMANPTSVMYTKDYTDKNVSNAHSWYGSVCSTFVCSFIGRRFYNTTFNLINSMEDKQIDSIYDIEIGDPIVMPGHILIVTQAYTDSKGVLYGFGTSEMTTLDYSVFRQITRSAKTIEDNIKNNGWRVKVNPNPGFIKKFGDVTYNAELLFEKGNNTYITNDDLLNGVWFYIPNVTTIYYKKDDGSYFTLDISNLPTKTINSYTVYNFAEIFDEIGDYYFTDDPDSKPCFIKYIDTGVINLSGNTLYLSGWNNCVPYNYYVIKEVPRTSSDQHYCWKPSEGYICSWPGQYCGEINVPEGATSITVTIPEEYLTGLDRYKVWLEYETGIGYKQEFSNLVIL